MAVSVLIRKGITSFGEGPHWDAKHQELIVTDMDGEIFKWKYSSKQFSVANLGEIIK